MQRSAMRTLLRTRTVFVAEAQRAFGRLLQTLSYHPDGSVASVGDGNGHLTTLSAWLRGIPQSLQFADLSRRAALQEHATFKLLIFAVERVAGELMVEAGEAVARELDAQDPKAVANMIKDWVGGEPGK